MTHIECKQCGELIPWDPDVEAPPKLCQLCFISEASSERELTDRLRRTEIRASALRDAVKQVRAKSKFVFYKDELAALKAENERLRALCRVGDESLADARLNRALGHAKWLFDNGSFDDSHDIEDCPCDDTCECEALAHLNALFAVLEGREDVERRCDKIIREAT